MVSFQTGNMIDCAKIVVAGMVLHLSEERCAERFYCKQKWFNTPGLMLMKNEYAVSFFAVQDKSVNTI